MMHQQFINSGMRSDFFQFTNLHPTPCACAWKEIYLYWMKILILWSRYRRHIVQIKLAIKYLVMANYPKILHFCNPEQYCLSKTIQLIDIVCENQYTCTVKQSIRDDTLPSDKDEIQNIDTMSKCFCSDKRAQSCWSVCV